MSSLNRRFPGDARLSRAEGRKLPVASVPAGMTPTRARACRPNHDAPRRFSRLLGGTGTSLVRHPGLAGWATLLLLAGCAADPVRVGDQPATDAAYAAVVGCATTELGALDDGISSADVVGRAIAGQCEDVIRAFVGRRAAAAGLGGRAREVLYEQLMGGELFTGMVLRSRNRAGFGDVGAEPHPEVGWRWPW